jgi:DNA-binding NtrC family response regulator
MARMLIIDDEEPVRAVLRAMLEQASYEVMDAHEGRTGMHRHQETPADVSLLDLFMAGQEGLETIRALRRVDPQVKILAISGGGGVGNAQEYLHLALLLGAQRALQKPFSQPELLDAVQDVIEKEEETGHRSPSITDNQENERL